MAARQQGVQCQSSVDQTVSFHFILTGLWCLLKDVAPELGHSEACCQLPQYIADWSVSECAANGHYDNLFPYNCQKEKNPNN